MLHHEGFLALSDRLAVWVSVFGAVSFTALREWWRSLSRKSRHSPEHRCRVEVVRVLKERVP